MDNKKIEKQKIVEKFGGDKKNSGKTEVQIALTSGRIKELTEHFKEHKKDNHSRYGLIKIVNKRRKLLDYLRRNSEQRYQDIIKQLGIRR